MIKYVEYRVRDLVDALPAALRRWWYWRKLSRRV